ncbi:MAG: galactoside O-acetyltransferase [Bacteroidetes bacterium GWF2_43_63]|nr:MAG: galactoside O-acetyltransferase [Bacteroidetes bacterium GWE2_42_42]OFY52997.1 MAG: galactoside O-acetyltransferase [Bacteroidetes bacterium GWF2_43_63]HCB62178.1 galactoside O-acetyltransferase [Bacteroidales bacterium]
METSFYSREELQNLGFSKIGDHVLISRFARFYNISAISIGNNVRIDDFCILSGNISLGNNIHISAFCALYGSNEIIMNDYSGLSPRTTIFSTSDDFSGEFMVGPMIPDEYRNVNGGQVIIGKYVQIGAGCVVFPDLKINDGVTVGALSLINKSLEPWTIYAGIPARIIKKRSGKIVELAGKYSESK